MVAIAMANFYLYLYLMLLIATVSSSKVKYSKMFTDSMAGWTSFRDPNTGLWCDTVRFPEGPVCGEMNNRYSSAGTGMGLVSDAIQAELKLISTAKGEQRAIQTLEHVLKSWPRDSHTGFLAHFTDASFTPLSEYSTIDTAELVLGANLAGNYFGGKVLVLATRLLTSVTWETAIESASSPTIYPVVNATTGEMSGNIRPYNEYYLVAYVAKLTTKNNATKAAKYFQIYYDATNRPQGPVGDGMRPVHKDYWGYNLLTDNNNTFMSSFIPQFCYYLSKEFHQSEYYTETMLPQWYLESHCCCFGCLVSLLLLLVVVVLMLLF